MTDAREAEEKGYLGPSFRRGLERRRFLDRILRGLGIGAILTSIAALLVLFGTIVQTSATAFTQTQIRVPVFVDPDVVDPLGSGDASVIASADYRRLVHRGLESLLEKPASRRAGREMRAILSMVAEFRLRDRVSETHSLIGRSIDLWVPASSDVDLAVKGIVPLGGSEPGRLSERQVDWVRRLERDGHLVTRFNRDFFLSGHSQEPEAAGIRGAVLGSALMLVVTLAIALPIGIAAAIYLEEFAPRNGWTELIDVNIRNLAAVPSIVFGILGLAVFLNLAGLPRSTPLVGGLVLALMTLPTIIITARAAVGAVPPSLREAALQLGASRLQATFLVMLPNALPGILTGAIIGAAQALGETAPLLMIGMVAFIAGSPNDLLDPAAPLPVQIYLWSTSPERGFVEKTAAGIVVLLVFLVLMNGMAVLLRNRTQKTG